MASFIMVWTKNIMINKKNIIRGLLFVMFAVALVLAGAYSIKRGKEFFLNQYFSRITNPLVEVQTSIAATQLKLDSIVARLSALEASVMADQLVTPGVLVFGMFDAVGPYRKNGLFEIYGASLRERRQGPIHVSQAEIEVTNDEAWIIWAPDHTVARDATHLAFDFVDIPQQGKLTVGFLFNDGNSGAFVYDTGKVVKATKNNNEQILPSDIINKASSAKLAGEFQLIGNRLIVALPPEYVERFKSDISGKISHWFIRLDGVSGVAVKLKQLALIRYLTSSENQIQITLSGQVKGVRHEVGKEIELINESGHSIVQQLALDGGFVFSGVAPNRPVSIRLREPIRMHYSNLGRWFVPTHSRADLIVGPPIKYINTDGHAPNQKSAKFIGTRVASAVAAFYEPHSRQYWPGAGAIQEYDSTTFANNYGYIDRDRFFDNPDNCVRIASTGGSDMVALQVRPFEKSNLILEETLGIALGKCVEVISAATDNGDIAVNYPRIRDYTSKFKPDSTLVSTLSGLMFQVSPKMLRDGTGLDPENSSLPNFYFNEKNVLTFRTASPVSPAFTIKPTNPEYIKGIPFGYTLTVPFEEMPKEGIEAFNYWSAILSYIEKDVPGQNIVMHSGINQAQCRLNCEPILTMDGRKQVVAGAKGFVRNMDVYCQKNKYKCIHPRFDNANGEKPNLLTFEFDGHYSPRGNQWLAQELTAPLVRILKTKKAN